MKIFPAALQDDLSRDIYWAKFYIESDQKNRSTMVLVGISYEYLWQELNIPPSDRVKMEIWLTDFLDEIKSKGDVIFTKSVHYYTYATTKDGIESILDFLENRLN